MTLDTQDKAAVPPCAGLSWGAVLGGATVATAMAIMLAALGSGLGLAWVSPIADNNPSGLAFTVVMAIWLIVVQWIASFFGGYLAGRLHCATGGARHEVEFRDTAAGFVAWAVAAVVVVGLAGSGVGTVLHGVARHAAATASQAAGQAADQAGGQGLPRPGTGQMEIVLDTLLRGTQPENATPQDARAEVARILAQAAVGPLPAGDHEYLSQVVAARTGLSAQDAANRVDQAIAAEKDAVAKARHIMDLTRKAASSFALYTFFSMLVGAFIACVAGALGGRQRDSLYSAAQAARR
ncbi:MAG: hypothetical protein ABF535_08265 [Acetobacter sp.]